MYSFFGLFTYDEYTPYTPQDKRLSFTHEPDLYKKEDRTI